MADSEVLELLSRLDGPVDPGAEVREALWRRVQEQLEDRPLGGPVDLPVEEAALDDEDIVTPNASQPGRRRAQTAVGAFVAVVMFGVVMWWLGPVETGEPQVTDQPALTTSIVPTSMAATTAPLVEVSGEVIALPPGFYPQDLAGAGGRLFVLTTPQPYGPSGGSPPEIATVLALEPNGSVLWQRQLGDAPTRVIADNNDVWVAHFGTGGLTRLDPATGEPSASVVPELPFDFGSGTDSRQFIPSDLGLGFDSVWMTTARGAVARISTVTGELEAVFELAVIELTPPFPGEMSVGPGGVWVAENEHGLTRIDPTTNQPETLSLDELDHAAQLVAVQGETIWVAGNRLARTPTGDFQIQDGGYVFSGGFRLSLIDAETMEVLGTTSLETRPIYLGTLDGRFGMLDEVGVFHQLESTAPFVTDRLLVTDFDVGTVVEVDGETWVVERLSLRLMRTTESVGTAVVDDPPPLTQATGATVYVSQDRLLSRIDVDAATVDSYPLSQLAPGDPPVRLVRRGDLLAAWGSSDANYGVHLIDPANPAATTLLSPAWMFIPSAEPDRVWLGIRDPDSPDTVRALSAVREVAITGEITVPDVAPPNGWWPIAAVLDGLLFQTDDSLLLWDPTTGEDLRTLPGPFPVATWGNRIASCTSPCDQIQLTDLDTNTETVIAAPEGVEWFDGYGGAFSPDGRYLAVVAAGSTGDSGVGPWTQSMAVIIDVASGSAAVVEGSRQTGWDYPHVAWTEDSEWLLFANGPDLLAYQPGTDTAYIVDVQLPRHIGMAAK